MRSDLLQALRDPLQARRCFSSIASEETRLTELNKDGAPGKTVLYRGVGMVPFRVLVRLKIFQLAGVAGLAIPINTFLVQARPSCLCSLRPSCLFCTNMLHKLCQSFNRCTTCWNDLHVNKSCMLNDFLTCCRGVFPVCKPSWPQHWLWAAQQHLSLFGTTPGDMLGSSPCCSGLGIASNPCASVCWTFGGTERYSFLALVLQISLSQHCSYRCINVREVWGKCLWLWHAEQPAHHCSATFSILLFGYRSAAIFVMKPERSA